MHTLMHARTLARTHTRTDAHHIPAPTFSHILTLAPESPLVSLGNFTFTPIYVFMILSRRMKHRNHKWEKTQHGSSGISQLSLSDTKYTEALSYSRAVVLNLNAAAFDTVPHIVVTPSPKTILLLLHN